MTTFKNLTCTVAIAAAAAFGLAGCKSTHDHNHDHGDHSGHKHSSSSAAAKAYPLQTCIVTDDKLDKDATVFVHQGQEIKICCDGCKEDFDKEPAKYLKKLAAK